MSLPVDIAYGDKNAKIQLLETALRSVGISLNYPHVNLITIVAKALKDKGGNLTLDDTIQIQADWEQKWSKYKMKQARKKEIKDEEDLPF